MRRIGLTVGVAVLVLGCSGRYEVGGMDMPSAGATSAPPSGAGAGGGVSRGDDMMVMMGTGVAGGSIAAPTGALDETCVPGGMPEPLDGPFAPPDVVWERMAPWFSPQAVMAPSVLPEATTYEWATSIVSEAHAAWDQPSLGYGSTFLSRLIGGEGPGITGGPPELDPEVMASFLDSEGFLLSLLLTKQVGSGRFGIFSQEPWLAAYPSITIRGKLLAVAILNQDVPAPPPSVDITIPPNPDLTRRERLAEKVTPAPCAACHSVTFSLGASLEHFGMQGELRALDQGLPIDASGDYRLPVSGRVIHFEDHVSLSKQLVDTCDAHLGVAARFVDLAWRREVEAGTGVETPPNPDRYSPEASVARVQQAFIRGGRTYRALLDGYLLSPAVLGP